MDKAHVGHMRWLLLHLLVGQGIELNRPSCGAPFKKPRGTCKLEACVVGEREVKARAQQQLNNDKGVIRQQRTACSRWPVRDQIADQERARICQRQAAQVSRVAWTPLCCTCSTLSQTLQLSMIFKTNLTHSLKPSCA